MLHTLRSPDVGNRIEEGKLPAIVSDALPPLSETALNSAGEQLDALSETRAAQQRLDEARAHVVGFLDVYRRYTAGVLACAAESARAAAATDRAAEGEAQGATERHGALVAKLGAAQQRRAELEEAETELTATISGIKESKEYADARDLDQREKQVRALARVADRSLQGAATARQREAEVVDDVGSRAGDVVDAAHTAAAALREARERLAAATVPGRLPTEVTAVIGEPLTVADVIRTALDDEPVTVTRPAPARVELLPDDPAEAATQVRTVKHAAETRAGQAAHRLAVSKDLAKQREQVDRAEERADEAEERSEDADREATESAKHCDDEAVAVANAWRRWTADGTTTALLGHVPWGTPPSGCCLSTSRRSPTLTATPPCFPRSTLPRRQLRAQPATSSLSGSPR